MSVRDNNAVPLWRAARRRRMSRNERTALAAFCQAHATIADFLAGTPASSVWVHDLAGADPVTLERLCADSASRDCTDVRTPLAELNSAIRTSEGLTEHIVPVTCSGRRRAIEVRSLPVPGAHGQIILTVRDVTVEEELKAKLAATASAVRELRLAATCTDREAVQLALSDPLTGLPNRRAFDIELDVACCRGTFALLIFDMDRFKAVNDELGHTIGDRLLQAVARQLARKTRAGDIVARLGGDEFAIVLNDVADAAAARETADRLLRAFASRLDLGDVEIKVGLSAGVALHRAGDTPLTVYREADMALHTAKARRRGTLVVHAEGTCGLVARDDLVVVKSLVSGRPIALGFEPVGNPAGAVVAHEAIVGGATGPATTFDAVFSTAVRFGLGRELLTAVLRRVCEATSIWGRHGPVHLRLPAEAVTVENAVSLVIQAMASASIMPSDLALELPLNAFLAAPTEAELVAAGLRSAGIGVVLGDWDMSFDAFRVANALPFPLVSFDAERTLAAFSEPVATVWRAAFASLADCGIAACARNVRSAETATALIGLGVAMTAFPRESVVHRPLASPCHA